MYVLWLLEKNWTKVNWTECLTLKSFQNIFLKEYKSHKKQKVPQKYVQSTLYFGKIVVIFYSQICLGNRHGEPTNSADAVKICRGRGTYNRHGKYQGRQFIDELISFLICCRDMMWWFLICDKYLDSFTKIFVFRSLQKWLQGRKQRKNFQYWILGFKWICPIIFAWKDQRMTRYTLLSLHNHDNDWYFQCNAPVGISAVVYKMNPRV